MTVRKRDQWRAPLGVAALFFTAFLAVPMVGFSGTQPPAAVPWALTVVMGILAAHFARRASAQRRAHQNEALQAASREAVALDRLHIAADLHDVVSHGLGAITLRARAGCAAAAVDPAAAAQALDDILKLSTAATTDLRSILTIVRDPAQPVPLQPSLSMADLPTLITRAREKGLSVTEEFTLPRAVLLTPGIQLTIAQVVREALENSLRHAGPTTAHVMLSYEKGGLVVQVDDEGPVPGWEPSPGAGHGLILLRERVAALGGELTISPHGRGQLVSAHLPLERS